jgi:DHA1 family multidrug resistance protein-like MFS transporter
LQHDINRGATEQTSSHDNDDDKEKEELDNEDAAPYHLSSTVTAPNHENHVSEIHSTLSRTSTQPYTRERFDVEEQLSGEKTKSIALAPTKTSDNTILVDWYSTTDPANPQNWHTTKKSLVLLQLCAYSLAVYGASSMYVPGEEGVMKEFHVGATPAALGLAIYVVGYGVGPLIFAPLSEIAAIGRNWVYIPTFFLFVILSIPTAVVKNYAGLLVLRFLTGFFGSPCLANGGASVGDMVGFMGHYLPFVVYLHLTILQYSLLELPIYLSAWTAACFLGPAIGPVVAGFAVQAKGWRWGLWEIVWLTGPIMIVFLFFYPETSADNILRRRAQRLRKRTGRANIKSQSEIAQQKLSVSEVFWDAIIKPIEIFAKVRVTDVTDFEDFY